jgi:hypothetical protein
MYPRITILTEAEDTTVKCTTMQKKSLISRLFTAKNAVRKFAVGISFARETTFRRIKERSEK